VSPVEERNRRDSLFIILYLLSSMNLSLWYILRIKLVLFFSHLLCCALREITVPSFSIYVHACVCVGVYVCVRTCGGVCMRVCACVEMN
jgi:hypothetical protein